MSLNVLIIDDHAEYRDLLAHYISTEVPEAVVIEHDPVLQGPYPAHFTGGGFDVVLLDYNLGSESGLDWLHDFRQRPDFPPIIVLTGEGDEQVAVAAIKGGAHDYIPKHKLTRPLLLSAMRDALRAHGAARRHAASSAPEVAADAPSHPAIAGYRILRRLSLSPTAAVYLAVGEKQSGQVVLKVITQVPDEDSDANALHRFVREYELIASVEHRNIVRIYGHGVTPAYAYLAMEYFPCGDLRARIRGPLSPGRSLHYARQIVGALVALHSMGVLHRDLKPANVMLRDDDSVALIDFGLARQMRLRSALTGPGEIFGTPYYMSPEQGQAEGVDERGDLYSVGVMLFEMLTGRKPYTAASPLAVIYKHAHAALPRLPRSVMALQPLIDRLMAKNPRDRYQSAAELLKVLNTAKKT